MDIAAATSCRAVTAARQWQSSLNSPQYLQSWNPSIRWPQRTRWQPDQHTPQSYAAACCLAMMKLCFCSLWSQHIIIHLVTSKNPKLYDLCWATSWVAKAATAPYFLYLINVLCHLRPATIAHDLAPSLLSKPTNTLCNIIPEVQGVVRTTAAAVQTDTTTQHHWKTSLDEHLRIRLLEVHAHVYRLQDGIQHTESFANH